MVVGEGGAYEFADFESSVVGNELYFGGGERVILGQF